MTQEKGIHFDGAMIQMFEMYGGKMPLKDSGISQLLRIALTV